MTVQSTFGGLRFSPVLLNLLTMVLGLSAGYFMTIQSLRLELAAKAELVMVEAMDRKLERLEVHLKEGVVQKEQFFAHARDVEARLARIEEALTGRNGEGNRGSNR